jgi:hypothetical protein
MSSREHYIYHKNPPSNLLADLLEILTGRAEAINIEPLALSIIEHWDSKSFDPKILTGINLNPSGKRQYNDDYEY